MTNGETPRDYLRRIGGSTTFNAGGQSEQDGQDQPQHACDITDMIFLYGDT